MRIVTREPRVEGSGGFPLSFLPRTRLIRRWRTMTSCSSLVDRIAELFRLRGASEYGGESVTQLEHGLQAALLAENSGATPALIVAALLHDVGHLLHELPDDAPENGIDDLHEELGHRWLSDWFIPEVAEPVRLHVEAKRYLCAVDPDYYRGLSEPSRQSLKLQGGPFTPHEVRRFEAGPHFQASVDLRRWDDGAKTVGLPTPPLSHFLDYISDALLEPAARVAS